MGHISNNLTADEDNVFCKTVLDDSKSDSNVDKALVLKHMKSEVQELKNK